MFVIERCLNMGNKTLKITISGLTGSGKTTVGQIIDAHLDSLGFDVTLTDDDLEYVIEQQPEEIAKRIRRVAESVKVDINTLAVRTKANMTVTL